jgi:hypothetical protein
MTSDMDTSSSLASPSRRSLLVERFINEFLDAACDSSRRSILELLVPPAGQDSPKGYELKPITRPSALPQSAQGLRQDDYSAALDGCTSG